MQGNILASLVCVLANSLQGLVKPDIVFFGQDLPLRFYSLNKRDFSQCDLLLVMGTSLEVGIDWSGMQQNAVLG